MENENENQIVCNNCGETLRIGEEHEAPNGDFLCDNCFNEFYVVCDNCGDVTHIDEYIYIEREDVRICEHCFNNSNVYTNCESCGEPFNTNNEGQFVHGGGAVCDSCFDDYYYCENCDEYYHHDEGRSLGSNWYCYSCYEELSCGAPVYGYHEFNEWKLYKTEKEKEPPYYIGFELEVQPKDYHVDRLYKDEALRTIYNNLNAICARDGSLKEGGFEIISHPQSFNYIMENSGALENVLNELIRMGYTSHDNDTCGLHFHVTRPENPDVIDRLWLILETYKTQIINLSRRTSSQINSWAKFLSDYYINSNTNNLKTLYYIKKTDTKPVRYLALNNQNNKTIEFRFFKGTLKYTTFMACVEFINNLMTLCSNVNIPIETITWSKLCCGKYISQYINERNIHADFAPTDNSLEVIKTENMAKIIIAKINNLFMQNARLLLNKGKKINTTKLTKIKDFYKKCTEFYRYYDELRDCYFSAIYSLNEYEESGNYKEYITQSKYILARYIYDNKLTVNISSQLVKLEELYNKGVL